MKARLIILLSLFCLNCFGQTRMVELNGNKFRFQQRHNDIFTPDIVEVYRNEKKILSHTMFHEDGDCSSIEIELGTYEIKGNQIIFYTYWASADRQGSMLFPFGGRKQIYDVDNLGKMKIVNSEIYLEDYVNGKKHNGMPYLKQKPKNKCEEKLLNTYVQSIEKTYNSKFVTAEGKQALLKEIEEKMSKKINLETKNWKEIYGTNVNM